MSDAPRAEIVLYNGLLVRVYDAIDGFIDADVHSRPYNDAPDFCLQMTPYEARQLAAALNLVAID
jgi:hypothetical protein